MSSACASASAHSASSAFDKVAALRLLLQSRQLDAYIVPSEDPHQSEYPPDFHKRREFMTGFTGSAGTALITMNHALLWTDARYYLQGSTATSFAPRVFSL